MKHEILLVDDDPGVRRMLLRVLEEEGYAVTPAADGLEAVESAADRAPELVLLDLNLPFQNGWETFRRLVAGNPSLPIIIITARPNQLFSSLAAGAAALMEKPLDLPKLLRTIGELLAEPATKQVARMAGKAAEFYYLPSKRSEPPAKRREEHVA
jgi:DNA-binding response OmpR family regulator